MNQEDIFFSTAWRLTQSRRLFGWNFKSQVELFCVCVFLVLKFFCGVLFSFVLCWSCGLSGKVEVLTSSFLFTRLNFFKFTFHTHTTNIIAHDIMTFLAVWTFLNSLDFYMNKTLLFCFWIFLKKFRSDNKKGTSYTDRGVKIIKDDTNRRLLCFALSAIDYVNEFTNIINFYDIQNMIVVLGCVIFFKLRIFWGEWIEKPK